MTGQPQQKTRGRRLWPSLLLLLATMAVVFGIGEIACRLAETMLMGLRWDWRESCIPAEEPALIYRLAPDRTTEVAGVPFSTNNHGFRDRPYPENLSPRKLRLAVLGDSLTAGFGVSGEEAFPRLLEDLTPRPKRAGHSLRVLNLGVPGYNLEQQAALAELSLARYRPRLVLLCLFVNDMEKPFLALGRDGSLGMPQAGLAAGNRSSLRGRLRSASYFYRFLGTKWDHLLRLTGIRPDQAEDQRRRYARLWSDPGQRQRLERVLLRTRELVGDAGDHRRLAVVLLPALFQLLDQPPADDPVRQALAETCGRLGIPLIDLLTPLAGEDDPAALYLPDDPHPSPQGHRRIAELLGTGLKQNGLLPPPTRGTRGGWSEPLRVTRTPGNSHTAALHDRSVAFDHQGRGHLVWFDASDYPDDPARGTVDPADEKRGRIYEIYHSVLAGGRWSEPVRLSPLDGRTSRTPDLLADGQGRISLIYTDERTGIMGIYARQLTFSGWTSDRRISPEEITAYKASSCIDDQGRFHLAFPGQLEDRREIFHGLPRSRPAVPPLMVGLTPAGGRCFFPGLVPDAGDGSLHLVWKMTPAEGAPGIYHRRLADGAWGEVTRLTPEETSAGQPAAWPADDGGAHVVWVDHRHGQPEIYYRLLGNGSEEERVTWHHPRKQAYEIRHPSVAQGPDGPVQLVWTDSAVGNFEVFHKQREASGWSPTTRITRDPAISMDASIYPAPDGTLHVVWDDQRDGNFEIYHATHPVIP